MSFTDIFNDVMNYIGQLVRSDRLTNVSYNILIKKLQPVSFEGDVFTLSVSGDDSDWARDMIEEQHGEILNEAFEHITGRKIKIVILSEDEKKKLEEKPKPKAVNNGQYEYTFDTFIVGKSNEFAHAACVGVAENPGGKYNPLFIYGDSGLGKTHLMKAISNRIQQNDPDANIIYVTGEQFTSEMIEAIKIQDTVSFKRKYRNADVLLVDDIQFISGKESTQEEFFHTFNELHNHGKQIVITSDQHPKNIKSLADRLRTRFESGLTADIGMPEYETRCAIVKRKAGLLDLELSEEYINYMAGRLKTSVRQLEGCVKKLSAYQSLMNSPPTMAQVQSVIREILTDDDDTTLTNDSIIADVAQVYGVKPDEIKSKSRAKQVSIARKAAAYVMKECTSLSLQDIGAELGKRDHATVSFYIADVTKLIESDPLTRDTIEDLIRNIKKSAG